MGKQHNRWLDWKIRNGLARRGRVGGRMAPKGLIAGLLYKVWWHRYDPAPDTDEPKVTQQSVGGALAPKGTVNDDTH